MVPYVIVTVQFHNFKVMKQSRKTNRQYNFYSVCHFFNARQLVYILTILSINFLHLAGDMRMFCVFIQRDALEPLREKGNDGFWHVSTK